MNKGGFAIIISFMLGVILFLLALALAPPLSQVINGVRSESTIKYTYYNNLRNWSIYSANLTNGEHIMNSSSLSVYQYFQLNKYNLDSKNYFKFTNTTLKLKKVGNPIGNITIKILEGLPLEELALNITNSTLSLSSIDTSFENITFNFNDQSIFSTIYPYYTLNIDVTGVDSDNYIVIGTTNITDNLFESDAYIYNNTNKSYFNIPIYYEDYTIKDVLFEISVVDGGLESIGLNCSATDLNYQTKGVCTTTDSMLPFFIATLLGIAGIIIGRIL